MSRRANGEGTIGKRKDGRWEARYWVTLPDGTRKRQSVIKIKRNDALETMKQEQALASQGTPVNRDGQTLNQFLDYWLENIAPIDKRPATLCKYEMVTRVHIKPYIGLRRLVSLSVSDVQALIKNRQQAGCSPRMIQIIRNVLSSALKSAQRLELIHKNVARLAIVPVAPQVKRSTWSCEQASTFLEHAKTHRLYPAFLMFFSYGMRRGEVLGLRWCDVDFENDSIHICQQQSYVNARISFGELKTKASNRYLPLLPNVKHELLKMRPNEMGQNGLVFLSLAGTPIDPKNLVRTFHMLRKEVGLPRITIHEIRHTTATLLKNLNVPARDAQLILGHSSVITTQQHYQHADIELQKEALETLTNTFSGVQTPTLRRQIWASNPNFKEKIANFGDLTSGGSGGARTHDTLLKSDIVEQLQNQNSMVFYSHNRGELRQSLVDTHLKTLLTAYANVYALGAIGVKLGVNVSFCKRLVDIRRKWKTLRRLHGIYQAMNADI